MISRSAIIDTHAPIGLGRNCRSLYNGWVYNILWDDILSCLNIRSMQLRMTLASFTHFEM